MTLLYSTFEEQLDLLLYAMTSNAAKLLNLDLENGLEEIDHVKAAEMFCKRFEYGRIWLIWVYPMRRAYNKKMDKNNFERLKDISTMVTQLYEKQSKKYFLSEDYKNKFYNCDRIYAINELQLIFHQIGFYRKNSLFFDPDININNILL